MYQMLTLLSVLFSILSATSIAHASTELDFDPQSILAVEPVEEDGQPYLRLDLDPRLPLHFVADGAIAYGMFRLDPKFDKTRHILAGYVISNVSTGLLHLYLPDNLKHRKLVAGLIGFSAGAVAGIAKELIDARGYGVPSVQDAVATAIGAGLGTVTLSLTFNLKPTQPKKRSPL